MMSLKGQHALKEEFLKQNHHIVALASYQKDNLKTIRGHLA